jgi:hypothetical protein
MEGGPGVGPLFSPWPPFGRLRWCHGRGMDGWMEGWRWRALFSVRSLAACGHARHGRTRHTGTSRCARPRVVCERKPTRVVPVAAAPIGLGIRFKPTIRFGFSIFENFGFSGYSNRSVVYKTKNRHVRFGLFGSVFRF